MKQGYWQQVWRQFRRNRLAVVALAFVLLLFLIAGVAPWITHHSPTAYNLDAVLLSPSMDHWMGTDEEGRDVFARMIYGTRISLSVGFVAVVLYVLIGILLGAFAG